MQLKQLIGKSKPEAILTVNTAMIEELKPIVSKIEVSSFASETHKRAVLGLKDLFKMDEVDRLTLAFDRYVTAERKDIEIEYDMEKDVEKGETVAKRKDDKIEYEARITASQIKKMENAVTITKDAFGENNLIVKKLKEKLIYEVI